MTEAEAERALELKNLVLGSVIPKDTEVREDDGKIYDQSVRPNAEVAEKTAIDIYVYKYVEPDVPDEPDNEPGGSSSGGGDEVGTAVIWVPLDAERRILHRRNYVNGRGAVPSRPTSPNTRQCRSRWKVLVPP